ncbi:MAG: site-2 protease family protein [Planctomycetaceae bacterium]|nr:site-2 protease family protein [Planctomycetaceae bacterium]
MPISAMSFTYMWSEWLWPVALMVMGLAAVVFFHELGHFIAAKAVGIKVERFALGFGPRLFGGKWGETDFCVNLVPLGGYVKMLGQEDVKDVEEHYEDPRAFPNKSVGARMIVIAAGVVMNVIFAAVLFVIVGMVGIDMQAPVAGRAVPGMPADTAKITWTAPRDLPGGAPQPDAAGIKAGDRIVSINGKDITTYRQLMLRGAFADPKDVFTFVIERQFQGRAWRGTLQMSTAQGKTAGSNMRMFGIAAAPSLEVVIPRFTSVETPFHDGDILEAIAGQPIHHGWELDNRCQSLDGKPAGVTVKRPVEKNGRQTLVPQPLTIQPRLETGPDVLFKKDGQIVRAWLLWSEKEKSPNGSEVTKYVVTMSDGSRGELSESEMLPLASMGPLDVLGMMPRSQVGWVSEVSPAADAGLRPGDTIVRVGDVSTPTFAEFQDALRAAGNHAIALTVERNGKNIDVTAEPEMQKDQAVLGFGRAVEVSTTIVSGVRENSPVDKKSKGKVLKGAVLVSVNQTPVQTWFDVRSALNALAGKEVTLTFRDGDKEIPVALGVLDESMYLPQDLHVDLLGPGVGQRVLTFEIRKPPLEALAWGVGESRDFIKEAYVSLLALFQRKFGLGDMTGPVGIGRLAIQVGRESPLQFVYFMAMISCFLAVMNFLPIPVVDGGHAVLLIVEKFRGKPLPARVVNTIQMVGLFLLIGVFLVITFSDIMRIFK